MFLDVLNLIGAVLVIVWLLMLLYAIVVGLMME